MKRIYPVSLVAAALILTGAMLFKRDQPIEKAPLAPFAPPVAPHTSQAPREKPSANPAPGDAAKTVPQQIAAGEKPVGHIARPTGPTVIGRDGLLTDQIARLAGLSEAERINIDQLLKNTRIQYDALFGRHATVVSSANGQIEVRADPFVEEGRQLYDWLDHSIKITLGNEKAAQFMAVAGDGVERAFGNFGAAIHSLRIFRDQPDGESMTSNIIIVETDHYGNGMQVRARSFNNVAAFANQCPAIFSKIPSQALRTLEP